MDLHYLGVIDCSVITAYAALLIGLGLSLRRQASASLQDYLVGSNRLPWWMLGFSGMAQYLDVAGTLLIVSFLFMLGPMGLFVELRGGAVLVLIPMMLWTGKWHRRSGCLTGAEWMIYRFGDGFGGRFAQVAKAVSSIVLTVGILSYLIKGIGLFLSVFFPFPPFECALGLVAVATLYTAMSGFYGVVVTDTVQSIVILVAVGTLTFLATQRIDSIESLAVVAERVTGNSNWTAALPQWRTPMPTGYESFQYLIPLAALYTLRNLLFGIGSGDDPKFFGAKSDLDCARFSLMWTCLMALRWPMMMGLAVLGLFLADRLFPDPSVLDTASRIVRESDVGAEVDQAGWPQLLSEIALGEPTELRTQLETLLGSQWREKLLLVGYDGGINPERVMPAVLLLDLPMGTRGLILVALIAASMSTFDSEVNRTAGFFTRDLYQQFVRPSASSRELIVAAWCFIVALVASAFLFAFSLRSVNDIWSWIIMGLGGGLIAPAILRFYWWRFNGAGFAVGTLAGAAAAVAQRIAAPDLADYWVFPIVLAVGLVGATLGSYLTAPTPRAVLESFYFTTLPSGWWGDLPSRMPQDLRLRVREEHRRDLVAIPAALGFQVTLFLLPVLLIIGSYPSAAATALVCLFSLACLLIGWFRHAAKSDELVASVRAWAAVELEQGRARSSAQTSEDPKTGSFGCQ